MHARRRHVQAHTPLSLGSWTVKLIKDLDSSLKASTTLTVNKATPTISTTLSATTVNAGGSVSDSATLTSGFQASGSVTYNFFSGGACGGTATVVSTVTVTNGVVPPSASHTFNTAGSFSWNAVYSGDTNNNGATSACEPLTVTQATPTVTTSISPSSPSATQTFTDTATLTGGASPTGKVDFHFYTTSSSCTGTSQDQIGVALVSGSATSQSFGPVNAGNGYSFKAHYQGDANNVAVDSACEPLTVTKASPSIATTLSATTIVVGGSVTDSATLSGATGNAGGTVTYNMYDNSGCSGSPIDSDTRTVTNGLVPTSKSFTPPSAVNFAFQAVYSGDANNNPATSTCNTEQLSVSKASPSLSTTLSTTTTNVGGSVKDSATLTGAFNPTGTVTYKVYSGSTCSTPPGVIFSQSVTISGGVIPDSQFFTFNSPGTYSWQATYGGDINNNHVDSACNEILTVTKASPTITTSINPSSTVTAGDSVTDTATVSGGYNPGGSVSFYFYSTKDCSQNSVTDSDLNVALNNLAATSKSFGPLAAGSYGFTAHYNGDSNNNAADSPCELLTVNKASTTTTTSVSPSSSVSLGTAVHDTSTVGGKVNGFVIGGTVTYSFYATGDCSLTSSDQVVTMVLGLVPDSSLHGPLAAGSYSFKAVYSGDSNYNPSTSSCESLTVNKADTTTSTAINPASPVALGTSVKDTSTVGTQVNGFVIGGTVTYSFYTNGVCTGSPTTELKTMAGGLVPDSSSQTLPVGSYSYLASYSGDSNYKASVGVCEPFSIIKASPTITTQLSASPIILVQSATDKATLAGGYNPTGTITFNVYGPVQGPNPTPTCSSSPVFTFTLNVNGNANYPSGSFKPSAVGSYYWVASYSGDGSNNAFTTACGATAETLAVIYASAGMCNGDAGHQILQPINNDGTSVFKQGSTVPAKFRVCDANGNSIGTPGVVSSFRLVKTVAGTVVSYVDEAVVSTTPDTAFRWDPTSQQWIFNINTKPLSAGNTYYYDITLNDGTHILFLFGLR